MTEATSATRAAESTAPDTHSAAPASVYAVALVAELVQMGVRDIVVCPGSRSQALALAAAEAERAGALRLHVRVDERSAAFFALGVARETGVPAPVIVTSGTAVANLMPAVLEAHEGRVPFIALTADRPHELRGRRSNQTTQQAGLFGGFARLSVDVDTGVVAVGPSTAATNDAADRAAADPDLAPAALAQRAMRAALGRFGGPPPGPVQLNLAFREPLSGWSDDVALDFGLGPMRPAELFAALRERRDAETAQHGGAPRRSAGRAGDGPEPEVTPDRWRTQLGWSPDETYTHDDDALAVVIAGEGAGAAAADFARDAGLPLLAEVVSGSRYGREAITHYAALIDDPAIGGLTERAIVFGHPSLTRQVPALLGRDDVEVIVVDPHTDTDVYDPSGTARAVRSATVAEHFDARSMRRWLGAWVVADRALRETHTTVHEPDLEAARATGYRERSAYARAEVAAMREPVTREMLVEHVWNATWPHDRLVVAASRLVRVLDGIAAPRALEVRAARGLAGIDGTVVHALGVAVASQERDDPALAAGVTRLLIGDLALLHDAGSLLVPPNELRPRLQIFVGDDGGGTIFDTLEAAETADAELFDRVMYTPQRVDLAALATAYGWEYRRIDNRGELTSLLTEPVTGPQLVQVPLVR